MAQTVCKFTKSSVPGPHGAFIDLTLLFFLVRKIHDMTGNLGGQYSYKSFGRPPSNLQSRPLSSSSKICNSKLFSSLSPPWSPSPSPFPNPHRQFLPSNASAVQNLFALPDLCLHAPPLGHFVHAAVSKNDVAKIFGLILRIL